MISVENASFTYPGAPSPILTNVSFEVPERSLLAILGPNGAGKTTLLRTMIGLQKWDSGRTLIDGTPISSMSTRALGRVLSYVPQARNASNVALTGLEMVMVGRAPHMRTLTQPGAREERMARDVLDEVGASHLAEMPCATMSGGQFQMILIARALVADPRVLVLDEPETGLDFRNQLIVLGLLERLVRDRGLAVIMNTHYPAHALRVADQVALFSSTHEAVVGPASSVMNADTLARVFGVDVAIGSVGLRGRGHAGHRSGSTVIRQSSGVARNFFITIAQVSHIFTASGYRISVIPHAQSGGGINAGPGRRDHVGSADGGRTVPQRWGEHEGGPMATGPSNGSTTPKASDSSLLMTNPATSSCTIQTSSASLGDALF